MLVRKRRSASASSSASARHELDAQQIGREQLSEEDPRRTRKILRHRLDSGVHRIALGATCLGIRCDGGNARERLIARVPALVDEHRLGDHLEPAEEHLQCTCRFQRLAERCVPVPPGEEVVH
jgi:hypothetical protein